MADISTVDVASEVVKCMAGKAALIAVLSYVPPDTIVVGRGDQKWIITIKQLYQQGTRSAVKDNA